MAQAFSFAKDKIKILVLEGVHETAVESLERAGYTNIRYEAKALPHDALKEAASDAHVIGVRSRTQLRGEVLE